MKIRTLVLASGEGTRLRPLTDRTNKGMLPVRGKPVLEHIVGHLVRHGFSDIVMAVGVKKEQVMEHFRNGAEFRADIEYSESSEAQGTAGEIARAKELGLIDDTFLLYYGDTLTGINLNVLYQTHRHFNALITTPVIRGIPIETSLVRLDDNGRIKEFHEKPIIPEMANIPVFAVDGSVLQHPSIKFGADFSRDVVMEMQKAGDVFGYDEERRYSFVDYDMFPLDEKGNYHYDVGTLARYERICGAFDQGLVGQVNVIK